MISKIKTHLEIGFDSVCYDVLPNRPRKPKRHHKQIRTLTIEHDPVYLCVVSRSSSGDMHHCRKKVVFIFIMREWIFWTMSFAHVHVQNRFILDHDLVSRPPLVCALPSPPAFPRIYLSNVECSKTPATFNTCLAFRVHASLLTVTPVRVTPTPAVAFPPTTLFIHE